MSRVPSPEVVSTSQWRYFELSIDTRVVELAPSISVLTPCSAIPLELTSMNFCGQPEGIFIYRIRGSSNEIMPQIRRLDSVLTAKILSNSRGQFGMYIHAEMSEHHFLYQLMQQPLIIDTPIRFYSDHKARLRFTGPDGILDSTLGVLEETEGVQLKKIKSRDVKNESTNNMLTERQREILQAAIQGGYYDHPRRMDQHELGQMFDITAQTAGEHLRKIESKLFDCIILRTDEEFITTHDHISIDVRGQS